MTKHAGRALPSVGEVLAPILERIPRAHQSLLIASAERMAADRYRSWAAEPEFEADRADLLACAAREEEIAGRIEALDPDAEAIQRDLLAKHPDLTDVSLDLFGDRPLVDQIAIQAQGERLGAATWRAFARDADPAARAAFEACALLEEESAVVLETILERQPAG